MESLSWDYNRLEVDDPTIHQPSLPVLLGDLELLGPVDRRSRFRLDVEMDRVELVNRYFHVTEARRSFRSIDRPRVVNSQALYCCC